MKSATKNKNATPKPVLQTRAESLPALRAYIIVFGLIAVFLLGVLLTKELLTPKVCFQQDSKKAACVYVEVAQTQAELEKGLGGHRPLGRNEGMLFIFPIRETYNFWMKDVLFPIDIVWIDDGMVVSYQEYAQPCADGLCAVYGANVSATHVVELPAGFLRRASVFVGSAAVIKIRN